MLYAFEFTVTRDRFERIFSPGLKRTRGIAGTDFIWPDALARRLGGGSGGGGDGRSITRSCTYKFDFRHCAQMFGSTNIGNVMFLELTQ